MILTPYLIYNNYSLQRRVKMIINGIMRDGAIVRPMMVIEDVGLCVASGVTAKYFCFSSDFKFGTLDTDNTEDFRQLMEFFNNDNSLQAIIIMSNSRSEDCYLCLTDVIDFTGYILNTTKNTRTDYTIPVEIIDVDDEDSIIDYEYLLDECPDLFI